MNNKRWVLKERPPKDFIGQFPEYPEFFVQLLWNLNLKNSSEVDNFLSPDYKRDLHDPKLLKDITRAAERVWQAVEKKEKVIVYGDYDADGITSSVVLSEFFKELGFVIDVYMPDRQTEGHGLSMRAVDKFIKEYVNLIITLDCGTTNIKEIERAQENGIDVVVIDHHQVIGSSPPAYAFVNQHQPGDKYPFKGLCGVGLAFKFFQVLIRDPRMKEMAPSFAEASEGREKWLLDLVALGTVADMAPLLDENRALVKYGLFVLAQNQRVGLKELFRVAKIQPEFNRETMTTNINAVTLGFSLGPRINAASRMSHAVLAYNLLMEEDADKARLLALELEENNKKRKRDIDFVLKDVISQIDPINLPDFIILSSDKWPITILGLIANRVTDKFTRPAILIQQMGEEAKASLRSVDDFDLIKALDSISNLLVQYGGHRAAAGCNFKTENIDKIKKRLNKYAKENLTEDMKTPKLKIGAQINPSDVSLKNAQLLEKLVPYGMANPQPKFLLQGLELKEIKNLGATSQHAKLFLADGGHTIEALIFFHNGKIDDMQKGNLYDIVGELTVNVWNGMRSPQFKIIDIKLHR